MKLRKFVLCALASAIVLSTSCYLTPNHIMASQVTEIENNGTTNQATNIPLNTEVSGALSNRYDKDYYRFELAQDSVVSLTYNYSDGVPKMKMELFDSQNKSISESVYTSQDIVLPNTTNRYNLPAGSYFVLISDYNGYNENTGNYTVKINSQACEDNREVEYNESMNTATEVEVNTEIVGNLSNRYDKDYYKFTVTGNGSITIEYNYDAGNANMKMILFNIDGSDRSWVYNSTDIVMPTKTNTFRVPEGTYYICISDYNGYSANNADYTLNINYQNESGKDYEIEYNGTTSLSNTLYLDRKIIGNLSDRYDKDYYAFSLSSTKDITLIYDYQSGIPQMSVSVLDQNSKEISKTVFTSQNDSFPYKIPLKNIAAGNYYIIVSDYNGYNENDADYTLTVSQNGSTNNNNSNNNTNNNNNNSNSNNNSNNNNSNNNSNNNESGGTVTTKPSATAIQSLKSTSKSKATITYKRISNATGYQIIYSPYKNFSSASYTTSKQTKVTLSNLRSKKTYYVKVRPYIKQNGKTVYGNYSSSKTIKVK